ncbi:redox-sensitive transcriptional activator SoxR [Shewanella sp. SR43-4]|jgi:MerR family redox-sensitive transcriptional activator SoxR|uniref:Redox-sensitive transcriptional activator SoxR n=1 Tax=Shewanella vesiculosa TaxID=518738 RepID=A0ABV0FYB5_9GAMM|nr:MULTISPECIES: redox-sensitive transcriptional activator SoxR [Shewanella]MBB1319442.1 redox-sensitive transcriptional activator SoxR [Shewanella sp. SR43-4]MBB1323872.1 redox-sensitive transcriptional activator SoxR [Shewanella sp. SR43-8]MBB1477636.1 redox-sensitive transcriptional activator SoxR [Shewanella sp. SG41-3]RPA54940.1 redox-sensitive transcriptional activator SoxR [Shewanella vesiculosa]UJL43950.1 redox-sensitive transcriptional activator SoxR [Shewanella vesiculosa]|tara:strand:- start:1128 stop:1574 length:447 start_codon:yes stop_codon:yes gene_type:complete
MEAELSVGQVAKRCGINVSAIHFYEQKGLISSWRNQGNQRRYARDVIRRISLIKAAQQLGISLDEIHLAFASLPSGRTATKEDWADLSNAWKQSLTQRIIKMQKLKDLLEGCIGCGCLSMKNCPLYNPDDLLAKQGPGPVLLNNQDTE